MCSGTDSADGSRTFADTLRWQAEHLVVRNMRHGGAKTSRQARLPVFVYDADMRKVREFGGKRLMVRTHHHDHAPRLRCRGNAHGAMMERFSVAAQQLFRRAQARASTGGEHHGDVCAFHCSAMRRRRDARPAAARRC